LEQPSAAPKCGNFVAIRKLSSNQIASKAPGRRSVEESAQITKDLGHELANNTAKAVEACKCHS